MTILALWALWVVAAATCAAAQSASCVISIRGSLGAYTSSVACTGDDTTAPLLVVAWHASSINNVVDYTFNGEPRVVYENNTAPPDPNGASPGPPDFSSPYTYAEYGGEGPKAMSDGRPALLSLGFPDAPSAASLIITLDMRGVVLPLYTDPATGLSQPFSGLKLAAVASVTVADSVIEDVSGPVSENAFGAVAFVDDASTLFVSPAVRFERVNVSRVVPGKASGALLMNRLAVSGYSEVSFTDCMFSDNAGPGSGSAIFIAACHAFAMQQGAFVAIDRCTFVNNSARGDGGAVFIGTACSPRVTDCTFQGNVAGQSGGALTHSPATASVMSIERTTFTANAAGVCDNSVSGVFCQPSSYCGGALQVSNSTTLTVADTLFDSNFNAGENGGAVCFGRVGFEVPRCYNEAERAPNDGATFLRTNFTNNYVIDEQFTNGGAIFDRASGGLTLDACMFTNNSAGSGGAVLALWTRQLTITGGTVFDGNTARHQQAGAVYASDLLDSLTVDGATFSKSRCSSETENGLGGAMFMERQHNLRSQCTMAKNYTASLSNVLFASNSCHDAGALAVWGVSHTIGPNATFFNNLAFKSGSIAGAVYIRGETDEAIIGSVPFQSNMTGANFTGNGARSQGGAVFYRGIWTPRVVDSVFESNTVSTLATTDGSNTAGAVFMNELELSPAFFERVVFRANRAFVAGAMLVVQSNLSMVDCWFDDNTAMESAGGLSWTQPITSPLYYQVNISGSNFTRNAATGYIGGAVRIQMAGAVIRGCLFEDNWADIAAGALEIETTHSPDTETIPPLPAGDGSDIDARGIVYILDTVFRNNTAVKLGGGAIFSSREAQIVLVRTLFDSNIATKGSGGAMYIVDCLPAVTVYDGAFERNVAGEGGGAVAFVSCDASFEGTSFSSNRAANGAAVSGVLSARDLGGPPDAYILQMTDTIVSNNTATRGGGGLFIDQASARITSGAWTANRAGNQGGAVFASGGGFLQVINVSTMRLNSAAEGSGGAIYSTALSLLEISGSTIDSSTAGIDGGCISASGPCVVARGSSLANCSASNDGGGIFVQLPTSPDGTPAMCESSVLARLAPLLSPAGSASGIGEDAPFALVVVSMQVTTSRAALGGGICVKLKPGSRAVLDQVSASSNVAASITGVLAGGGGGIAVSSLGEIDVDATTWTTSVLVSSGSLASNTAQAGTGGGALLVSPGIDVPLFATFANMSVVDNGAPSGGGLAVRGSGAFLTVSEGSSLARNVASPVEANARVPVPALGGCIYATNCRGWRLLGGSELSGCNATGAGSLGGGVMTDRCDAALIDSSSVMGCSAPTAGGVAAADMSALVVNNATVSGNSATLTPTRLPAQIEALVGSGGALWVWGNTSVLVAASKLSSNAAASVGGGVSVLVDCPVRAEGYVGRTSDEMPAITVPSELSAYSDAITTLTNATLYGCYTLTLQGSLLMSNFAASSGGGVFSSHETGLIIDGCDAYSNRSAGGRGNATASASGQAASMPVVPRVGHGGGLASLAACGEMAAVEGVEMRRVLLQAAGLGNSVGNGYGADIATLPTTVAILRAGVLAVEDGAQNETKTSTDYVPPKNPLPPIRFSGNTLVLPSTSPVTVATVPMRLTDALGQDVRDPLLGSVISILAGSNVTDYVTMVLVGDNVAEYNTTDGTFIFQGLGVRGVVGQNYILTFNVTSSMAGGNQIPLLEQLIQVPTCADGEVFALEKMTCVTCRGGTFAFALEPGQPASLCHPCPDSASCLGGAVLVPTELQWHSAPNSSQLHQCVNRRACKRSQTKVEELMYCQKAWWSYFNLNQTMSDGERMIYAEELLDAFNCTLLSAASIDDPYAYQSIICAEGYGGNMCGMCVPMYDGTQTALKSNSLCGECGPKYTVYLVTAAFFVINLLVIYVQIMTAMGEQILSNTIQFPDIMNLLIMHLQYLVVVLRIQMIWPESVIGLSNAVSAVTNFADQALKVASLGCISDGSPEGQAEYTVAGTLIIPALLCTTACIIWVLFWLFRVKYLYPKLKMAIGQSMFIPHGGSITREDGKTADGSGASPTAATAALSTHPTFNSVMSGKYPDLTAPTGGVDPVNESTPIAGGARAVAGALGHAGHAVSDTIGITASPHRNGKSPDIGAPPEGYPGSAPGTPSGGPRGVSRSLNASLARSADEVGPDDIIFSDSSLPPVGGYSSGGSLQTAATFAGGRTESTDHDAFYPDIHRLEPSASAPANYPGWGKIGSLASQTPLADIYEDEPTPSAVQLGPAVAPAKLDRPSLQRWHLPGAENPPSSRGWFEADDEARNARITEEKYSLTLFEKFRLMDKYMPLHLQLFAVLINSFFVLYEGWASAALSPFACQDIDDGTVLESEEYYYANYQQAVNSRGYWQLNMNQACYKGEHLSKWTPIGIVMSIIVCFGIPLCSFLPVWYNRARLTTARVQLYWGWMYMRFYYNRVPYWAAFSQLELLSLVIVSTFTSGFESDLQQAAILQVNLLVILVINTVVWPHVHNVMTLMSFLSFAVLTLTVALSVVIGDGSGWELPPGSAEAVAVIIIVLNVAYVLALLLVSYKHLQDVLEEGYLATTHHTQRVVTRWAAAGKDAHTNLKSYATVVSRNLAQSSTISYARKSIVRGGSMFAGRSGGGVTKRSKEPAMPTIQPSPPRSFDGGDSPRSLNGHPLNEP